MMDVFLFFQQGWKNAWQQKTIWLFSALPVINQLLNTYPVEQNPSLVQTSLLLFKALAFVILYVASLIGVPYLAYCSMTNQPTTVSKTLTAIRRLFVRTLGCSCLAILVFLPLFFIVFSISINNLTQLTGFQDKIFLSFLPLSIFAAFGQFILFGFIANDHHIRQSIKEAWSIFRSHFSTLALIGITMAIIFWITSIVSGTFTVLVQSGFNLTSLDQIDYINPTVLLAQNKLYLLINGICQMIERVIETFVYMSAYMKYGDSSPTIKQTL